MLALILALQVPAADVPGGRPLKIAVMPTRFEGDVKVPAAHFDDALLAETQNYTGIEVIGRDDIDAMLGFDVQKQMLGCSESQCLAQIGGALGVDKLMEVRVASVSGVWAVTAKLLNPDAIKVDARSSRFVEGDVADLFRALPTIVAHLFSGGGVQLRAPAPAAPPPGATAGPAPAPAAPGIPTIGGRQLADLVDPAAGSVALQSSDADLDAEITRISAALLPTGGAVIDGREGDAQRLEQLLRARSLRRVITSEIEFVTSDDAIRACHFIAKDARSCLSAGRLILAGVDRGTTVTQSGEYFEKACAMKDAAACDETRHLIATFSARSKTRDDGGRLIGKMCLAGDKASCQVAQSYPSEAWVEPMVGACRNGQAQACALAVSRGRHWDIGRTKRTIGLWVTLLGTPLMGGLGAYIGYVVAVGISAGEYLSGGFASSPAPWDSPTAVAAWVGTTAAFAAVAIAVGFGFLFSGVDDALAAARLADDVEPAVGKQAADDGPRLPSLAVTPLLRPDGAADGAAVAALWSW